MDKLYGTRALLIKACYCFCLPLLQLLLTAGSLGESLGWLFATTVLLGCLYTVPFWCSVVTLFRHGGSKLVRLIAWDALCCLAPAVGCSLLYEMGMHLFVRASALDGLYTLLLLIILLFISGIFWLLYRIAGKHTRP